MPVIRFGEFELDQQTYELRKNGARVRVQQQPARVLSLLLSHPGSMVSRDQIRTAIWGDNTFVDFELSLNFCIRQIRIALNDQAEKPRFVETLPRLGYRFVGTIESGTGQKVSPEHRLIRIAMAPVESLGGDVEEYFAAGLSYDMMSALSRIDPAKFRVIVGPRIQSAKPLTEQMEFLKRNLDIEYLLRASVRRTADTVRINVQLLDLQDLSLLWSDTYDRKSSDLLAVQEEVAIHVCRSLALELLPGSTEGSRRYSGSSLAYDAYLKGRFFGNKLTSDSLRSSVAYFTEAIAIDAGFAPAYAGLADCYAQMGSIRVGIMKPLDALAKARPLLQRAMDLDNTLAEAHCTFGLLKIWYDLDWAGSEREFEIALNLDRSHTTALLWQSVYLSAMRRYDEAVASVKKARESDPLSPIVNTYLGVAQMFSGQYDLAIRQISQAIELDPHNYRPHLHLGIAYSFLEEYQDSVAAFRKAFSMNPANLESLAYMGQAMAEMGDRKGALSVLKKVKAAESRTASSLLVAGIYSSLGEDSRMFQCLQKAFEDKCSPLYLVLLHKNFRRYEADPRYRKFLISMGVPQLAKN